MQQYLEFVGNHPILFLMLAIVLALLSWNLFSSAATGGQLDAAAVTRLINHEGALLIDIREADAYARGHILNAVNIPEKEIHKRLGKLASHKDKPVILCCNSGTTTGRAASAMKEAGFTRVSSLKGGIMAWQNAGLPLVKGS